MTLEAGVGMTADCSTTVVIGDEAAGVSVGVEEATGASVALDDWPRTRDMLIAASVVEAAGESVAIVVVDGGIGRLTASERDNESVGDILSFADVVVDGAKTLPVVVTFDEGKGTRVADEVKSVFAFICVDEAVAFVAAILDELELELEDGSVEELSVTVSTPDVAPMGGVAELEAVNGSVEKPLVIVADDAPEGGGMGVELENGAAEVPLVIVGVADDAQEGSVVLADVAKVSGGVADGETPDPPAMNEDTAQN